MDGDRLTAAVERYILSPDEKVIDRRDWPDSVAIKTNWGWYDAEPANWLVAREAWVEQAVRLVMDASIEDVPLSTFGLLLRHDREVLYLNDQATMRGLGGRMGDDLDPIAYAELLAEFYSGPDIDRPVVAADTVSDFTRPGWLVQDVDATLQEHPHLESAGLAPPRVTQTAQRVELSFHSCRYYLDSVGIKGSFDVLRWTVTGGAGQEVSWRREYVVKGVKRA
ncbi:hypothetical protein ACIBF5_19590 [Micromonospora sp. NPDC050417]|uniref:hypothetical protein n=1 Tax=Micromonospora sp. NPDC050417 TaxID=3364280 RepID=UPI0037BD1879